MPRFAIAGFSRDIAPFTIPFPGGTGQVTSLLSFPLGFAGVIEKVTLYSSIAATGAGASRTFNIRRGTATGTVMATATVVLADLSTVGVIKDVPVVAGGTPLTASFVDADTLTIEWATAGAVAFTAGTFHVCIRYRGQLQKAA